MRDIINTYRIPRYIFSKIPHSLKTDYRDYTKIRKLIRETEKLSYDQLLNFQVKKLKDIINYAWQYIEGYRELWGDNNFHPDKFNSLNDLSLIPFITKDILRENSDKFTNHQLPKLRKISTGGSVGIPLKFYQERKNIFIEKAFIHDIWSRKYKQITPTAKSTILRGRNIRGIYDYDPMHGLILSAFEITPGNVEIFIKQIEKYRTPILQAYPSALYNMALIIKEYGLTLDHTFNCLMFGSEPLYDFQRELFKEVFKTEISHWYGLGEKVALAGNCNFNDKFHIYPQYGMVEVLDQKGIPVNEGQVGEIVGTGYWNYATPFIRYKTMDFAELGANHCSDCSLQYQLLNRVEGRLQEYIVGEKYKLIALTGVSIICGKFKDVFQFRFYQDTVGKIIFKYIKKDIVEKVDETLIHDSLKSKLGEEFDIKVEQVDEISRTKQGKLRYLDQKLDVNNYL
jgi:phenylacetate-CoA ligase